MQSFPRPLSAKEEKECIARCRAGDKEARECLIERNLRLVAYIAKKIRMKSEQYILDNLEGIDLSTMAGRIKYHRIRQGISKMEVGSRIGMQNPNSYAKTYENEKREVRNLVQVQKICKVLNVDEQYIFDDYMSFNEMKTVEVSTPLFYCSKSELLSRCRLTIDTNNELLDDKVLAGFRE